MLWRRDAVRETIARINDAGRMRPPMPETTGLLVRAKYDIYSSIVETRGNAAAVAALEAGQRVILGLRNETSTLANRGRGLYDDRIVVMARGSNGGEPSLHEFLRASTEPTAQYDGSQRRNPTIKFRRAVGKNVFGDAELEQGRPAEGTIEMGVADHPNSPIAGTLFSLRPTAAAVRSGAGSVQRDTNHDGYFNAQDTNGIDDLDDSFKIHSGSMTNTDSAGCQTVHPQDYIAFRDAVRADAGQRIWQYVLTEIRQRPLSAWRVPMRTEAAPGLLP